jgi:virulence-associated protein VapD
VSSVDFVFKVEDVEKSFKVQNVSRKVEWFSNTVIEDIFRCD